MKPSGVSLFFEVFDGYFDEEMKRKERVDYYKK